jgi:hypothetical protein
VTKTYIDSGVLIAAARGKGSLCERALAVLRDTSEREFVSSDYVKLETIPKPTYFGREAELKFYNFDAAHLEEGLIEACQSGLQSLDAVHVILAVLSGCDELVTTEKPTAAIHRTSRIRVVSIDT